MLFHFLTFFCAASCDIICGIFQSINTSLFREQGQSAQVERLNIVVDVFTILQTLVWDLCQVIMLYVFIKYGQPVEKDSKRLFCKKLEALYQD